MRPWVLVWVFIVPLLAGCLDDGASLETDDASPMPRDGTPGPPASHVLIGDRNVSLAPWLAAPQPITAAPQTAGLVQLTGYHEDGVLMRLLFDGAAFFLTGRPTTDAATFDDTVFVARIVGDGGSGEIARNHTRLVDGGEGFVMVLPAFDRIRMGTSYRLEVYGFHWLDETTWCTEPCPDTVRDPIGSLVHGRTAVTQGSDPQRVEPVAVWQTPIPLTSRASVTLEGPTEGTDRADAVESKYVLGPETATYTVTVNGVRIWRADLLLEFDDSRVHATRPELYGNGTRALDVFLVGHRPLDVWRYLPAEEGFDQSFTLEVDVDLETGHGDLPEDGAQYFFATLQHGYRIDGTTYVAGSSGDDLSVQVRVE